MVSATRRLPDLAQALAALAHLGFLQDVEPERRALQETTLLECLRHPGAVALAQLGVAEGFDPKYARQAWPVGRESW